MCGTNVDKEEIKNEIEAESLSNEELYERIESFFETHAFGANLYSCGACGIREYESNQENCKKIYKRFNVTELPSVYRYSVQQLQRLQQLKAKGPIKVCASDGTEFKMEPWKIISYFECPHSGDVYHLHPELVETENANNNGIQCSSTMICP